jgi:hypothetical protein
MGSDYPRPLFFKKMQIVTAKSNKDDIVGASMEVIDGQAERITELEQKFNALLWIAAVTVVISYLA